MITIAISIIIMCLLLSFIITSLIISNEDKKE